MVLGEKECSMELMRCLLDPPKAFGYQQNSIVQGPEAIFGIKIIWYVVVNVFAALSLIFVYFYPLHGEKLDKLELELKELHQKKIQISRSKDNNTKDNSQLT